MKAKSGTGVYAVVLYDPVRMVCDLKKKGSEQGGFLYDVPIWFGFAGSQNTTQDIFPSWTAPEIWGEYEIEIEPEGIYDDPRWGLSYPMQPGDYAYVEWVEGEPMVVDFARITSDMGPVIIALANEQSNSFFSQSIPTANKKDRYDFLLPTGAWQRSHKDGSWTTSPPPVQNPRSFLSQFGDGKVRLWSRSQTEDDYLLRMDFQPNSDPFIKLETIPNVQRKTPPGYDSRLNPSYESTVKLTFEALPGDVSLLHVGNLVVDTGQNATMNQGGDLDVNTQGIATHTAKIIYHNTF